MKKTKKIVDLFKLNKIQLIRKVNTLELKNTVLENTIKDELFKIFMNKLNEPQELEKIKQENKNLRSKKKTLERLLSDFDKEINRLFNIIKDAYKYVDDRQFVEINFESNLKDILSAGLNKNNEVDNAKTTPQ